MRADHEESFALQRKIIGSNDVDTWQLFSRVGLQIVEPIPTVRIISRANLDDSSSPGSDQFCNATRIETKRTVVIFDL